MAATTSLRAALGILLIGLLILLAWAANKRSKETPVGSMLEHFSELRKRLLWSLFAASAAILFVFSFKLGPDPWWLPRPALHETVAAQAFEILAHHVVPSNVNLVVLRPFDGLSAELTISMGLGLVLASPIILGQIGGFIMPALHDNERRMMRRAFLPVLGLFLLGAWFAVYWVVPTVMEALYGYATALGAQPMVSVADVVSFTMMMALLFGAAFQTPLAMTVLSRVGVVRARTWQRYWRHAIVAIVILCAFVVDGTALTLLMVATPLVGLYGLGILGAYGFSRKRAAAKPPSQP